jgi:signal peptidase I
MDKPALYATSASELSLSGESLQGLMVEVLTRGVPFRFRATGWSMAPFIRNGDIICISPIANNDPSIGEVVAFTQLETNKLIVHRIIGKQGASYIIQGDNAPECPDSHVPQENLLGRVTSIEREGKQVSLGLGPERYIIAYTSKTGWFLQVLLRIAKTFRNKALRIIG